MKYMIHALFDMLELFIVYECTRVYYVILPSSKDKALKMFIDYKNNIKKILNELD